jgi:uncharacterized protein
MNQNLIVTNTIVFVKQQLTGAEGGHDWFHVERVWKNAKLIAATELGADLFTIELGALLHDIADSKFHAGDETLGPRVARQFLVDQQVLPETIDHVEQIIRNISFKGGHGQRLFKSAELDIIQDADRLDALGAIGIARTFNYGGFKNRAIYDPAIAPDLNMGKAAYKNSVAPTVNHFYEKLLLLKDLMNTVTGKKLAAQRHEFMVVFLDQFYAEWNGTQ